MFIASAIFKITLVLLFIITIIFILLLIIPFRYIVNGKIEGTSDYYINVSYIIKLLNINFSAKDHNYELSLSLCNKTLFHSNLNNIKNKKYIKHKNKPHYTSKNYFDKKFLYHIKSYVKSILTTIKPSYIKIDGTYGLEDPSATGILCALISILPQIAPVTEINLNPNFDEEILDIKLVVYGKIFLLSLVIKTLRFLLSKEIRKKVFKKSKTAETY